MIKSIHGTSQEAWAWINEFLATQEVKVRKRGGIRSGPQIISYDHFMEINKAWVDPEFDFGYTFGYKKQKWNILKSNYIDMNMLDLVKSEVLQKESKKAQNYNLAFKFSNSHGSGHGCLVSLVFQRRYTQDNPLILINIRSSEVTKRLLMDFLLVQRIAEYIYGEKESVSLKLFSGNVYLAAETFVMYHNYKDLRTFLNPEKSGLEKKILETLEKYEDPQSLVKVRYKSHLRAVKRIQKVDTSSLKAKDCLLF